MRRRTFIKSLAAAALVPTISLRFEINREKLLSAFCWPHDYPHSRWNLERPFIEDGVAHATDVLGMARCRLELPAQSAGEIRLPPMWGVWEKHFRPVEWRQFSLPDWRDLRHTLDVGQYPCPACGSRRVSLGDHYPDNDWITSEEAELRGYDVDDNSVYDASCEACHGTTNVPPGVAIVCGVPVNAWYLKRISALPGAAVAASKSADCICFRADGFVGVQMGVRRRGVVRA